MKVVFDTNCISIVVRGSSAQPEQTAALRRIFIKKAQGGTCWVFCYLDIVKRELMGHDLSQRSRADDLKEIIDCFDEKISLSRFPVTFPVRFPSNEDLERQSIFAGLAKQGAVSVKDARVLSDAIGAGCTVFVTVDMKLVRNMRIAKLCKERYGMQIVSATGFESSYLD